MSSILLSLRALAKVNNGFFKSKNQADFLLSQCDSSLQFKTVCTASIGFSEDGNINNEYFCLIQCDAKGVVSITHEGKKSGKIKTVFTRLTNEELHIKQEKIRLENLEYDTRMAKAQKRIFRIDLLNKQLNKLAYMSPRVRNFPEKREKLDKIFGKISNKLEGFKS